MEVEQVFPGVYEMRTSYGQDTSGLTGEGAMPHALWFLTDPTPAILDPGPTVVAREALQAIVDLGYDPETIEYAIPSHIHVDHAGGCGWLTEVLPRVRTVIHSRGAKFLVDPTRLREGTASVFGADWEEVFGPMPAVPKERLIAAEDGDAFTLGGRRHRVVYLPGHSLDHFGMYDEELGALYCGHAAGHYTPGRVLPEAPATLPYFDVEAALSSMARMREIAPRYLLPVHSGFLASNPGLALDMVERITRGIADIVVAGRKEGATPEAMEERVRTFLYADPTRAAHGHLPQVMGCLAYYDRLERKGK